MKKLFTLLLFLITLIASAQAPQGFNYQATVRNSVGALITNQNVYFKFNVMLNSSTSVPIFSETHYVPTDDLGQVSLVIGAGTASVGTFSSVNWGIGNYFLGIELDINTGLGYVAMGTTQLLSVPYALYANSSASSTPQNLTSVLNAGNSANNTKIVNLGDPVNPKDAVNKDYVDAQIFVHNLSDLDDAHSGGTDFNNSIQIGNAGPYTYTQAPGNTGVGKSIFNSLTTGFNNSTFGFESFKNNTIGNNNVSMGYRALYENDEGSYNVAIGAHSLERNKVSQAGSLGGPGFQNVAIGSFSLQNAISNMNVAVGTETLRNLTTGGQNIAMGEHALRDLTTGSGNVSIGYSSMILTSPTASSNTSIGTKAGEQNQGSNNIFIGDGSGQFNNGSGNILIGKNSGLDNMFHMQSNILIIENSSSTNPLIFGDFQNKSVNINNTLTVSSNIGVGVTSPQRPLHISDVMRIEPRATEPANPSKGDIYMDDNTNKLRVYDGTQWQNCW